MVPRGWLATFCRPWNMACRLDFRGILLGTVNLALKVDVDHPNGTTRPVAYLAAVVSASSLREVG